MCAAFGRRHQQAELCPRTSAVVVTTAPGNTGNCVMYYSRDAIDILTSSHAEYRSIDSDRLLTEAVYLQSQTLLQSPQPFKETVKLFKVKVM
jgi:hypothetical protein